MPEENLKVDIKVMVTSDKLKASVILMLNQNGVDLTFENVMNALRANKISYGIDENAVKKLVETPVFGSPVVVAQGKPPGKPVDGKLIYHFDIKREIKPKELPNGRVDYKDLGIVQNVRKDDVLVTMIDPVDGENGIDVFGGVIRGQKGKKVNLPRGKNTYIDADGHTLRAACDGQVSIIEGKVVVLNTLEISSDIDNSTGNINFVGNVHIKGSVLSGFKVVAEGNVEVEGIVEAAEIEAKGNVILHKGITGMGKGRIISQKSVVAKFIENATVIAADDIQAEAIVHSDIKCGGKLTLIGKKASIVGGTCKVGKEVEAKVIGSYLSTTTEIEVGVDPIMIERYRDIKKEIAELKENIKKCEQGIEVLRKIEATGGLTDEKREMLQKFTRSKIVSAERLKSLQLEFEEIEKRLEERNEGMVKVQDVIYPGVKITIGNVSKLIKEPVKYCKIYREDADIKIAPYS
ncbi:protein of unknown function DUF342 [Caldicellulosiruptor saccharolyticus DSM 8903]|uniref:Flagellar Assembly Protein A N-terminal region domain-containing protein n=1 Tax=Caldicellulosiruptor saccharolyticus (strain ATCC 43494 / DSM 8903 / Tp8T 6331) TaxID=351627 RepID=A4XJ03_CALS8|nr:FapA family protein [Caldicellulosiruptor saccharolyticus]ABP66888.1 protein of unknown function DUF342 [Caldicellulosiruptor saccharolyticus DSM 8903]